MAWRLEMITEAASVGGQDRGQDMTRWLGWFASLERHGAEHGAAHGSGTAILLNE